MFKVLLIAFLMLSNSLLAGSLLYPTAVYSPVMSFAEGLDKGQVSWNHDEKAIIPDGPFQGPMAFAFDQQNNLLIADSLNSKVLKVDPTGKFLRDYDLAALLKEAGLENPPALVDLIFAHNGSVLLADASNNAVVELNLKTGKCRAHTSPSAESENHWSQINHIHTDNHGNIFIEDVAKLKTHIIDKSGKPVKVLHGQVGISVSADSRVAIIIFDDKFPHRRAVYTSAQPGEEMRLLAVYNATEPILWCQIIGYDKAGNLHTVFDTSSARNFVTFNADGEVIKSRITSLQNPGYEPNRLHSLNNAAEVFSVRIKHPLFEILKVK